jgi:putative addiction module component (TIGR02574 family)
MENIEMLFKESLKLRPAERLQLIELIAKSLDQPDEKINEVWATEAESRYQAMQNGKVNTISLSEIVARYK